MIFITGPLYSGKREYACSLLGCSSEELERHAVWDVQELAGGVVPVDPDERAAREAAGRLGCLLAQRAERVVRVFCGLPVVLK